MNRPISDAEPFDLSAAPSPFASETEVNRARADARRRMRLRFVHWAEEKGFRVEDEAVVQVVESVEVRIELSRAIAEMCSLRATALRPKPLHAQVRPRSWRDWFAARFGGRAATADHDFDEHWSLETDPQEEALASRLLDARVRAALSNEPIWCTMSYTDGQIELRLDSGEVRLTGAHLLAATEVVVAAARAALEPPASPYR
jgi:hypothetical protein